MIKIIQRNKKKISKLCRVARANEMPLPEFLTLLERAKQLKIIRKKSKKYGTEYDWNNAKFDNDLNWLFVPEVICSPKREQGCISVVQSIQDIPEDQREQFSQHFKKN